MSELLFGRQLTPEQLPKDVDLTDSALIQRAGMVHHGQQLICQRCLSVQSKRQGRLPAGGWFCISCLALGRITSKTTLVGLEEPNAFVPPAHPLRWHGQLTRLQANCAKEIEQVFLTNQRHLLWAVTGAGKTEMLFNGLGTAISAKKRIAIASPRIDVCRELYPRLQAAFPEVTSVLLHGGQEEPYKYAQLTVCTTHQLFKFYHAFDVLVVDEVDAFRFAQSSTLQTAVKQALKESAACLYLTATPSAKLLRQVKQKQLTVSYLPLRYHGHLLPEIKLRWAGTWQTKLQNKKLPKTLVQTIQKCLTNHQRFLLFIPHVKQLELVSQALQRLNISDFLTVHAADPKRIEKVQAMRDGTIQFLVTTTILERGVTFPDLDVFVLGADDPVFSTAALIQIAGRAGRSAQAPMGHVIMWVTQRTHRFNQALRQIRYVNYKGRKLPEWRPVQSVSGH